MTSAQNLACARLGMKVTWSAQWPPEKVCWVQKHHSFRDNIHQLNKSGSLSWQQSTGLALSMQLLGAIHAGQGQPAPGPQSKTPCECLQPARQRQKDTKAQTGVGAHCGTSQPPQPALCTAPSAEDELCSQCRATSSQQLPCPAPCCSPKHVWKATAVPSTAQLLSVGAQMW